VTRLSPKRPSDVRNSQDDTVKELTPEIAEELLLTQPSPPKPLPDPDPTNATGSIEGISTVSHTSSRDGTSSNSTPPVSDPKKDSGKPSMAPQPRAQSPTLPGNPGGPSAPTRPPSINQTPVVQKPPPDLTPLVTTPEITMPNDHVTPTTHHNVSTLSSTQSADPKDVESLVKVPPNKSAISDVEYYWVANLECQVNQSTPGFTPSPYQLFVKIAINVFDQVMKDIKPEE
jgi:hypothetical protein